MTQLLGPLLMIVALLATMSGLLYVLTAIDPQTDRGRTPAGRQA